MTKRVVVVGGGAGGMSTAIRLRRLDESMTITVFEKGPHVSYASCGIPYALGNIIKDDTALLLHSPQYFKQRFNVNVHTQTEVVGIDRENKQVCVQALGTTNIQRVDYDKLVLSQGAEPAQRSIDGTANSHLIPLQTISDLHAIQTIMINRGVRNVCIVGGGSIGIEAAENLQNLGLKVFVIERAAHIIPGIDGDVAEILHTEIRRNGVKLLLHSAVKEVHKSHVVLYSGDEVPAELVILAAGTSPRLALAQQAGLEIGDKGVIVESNLTTCDENIYAIGDMAESKHAVTKYMRRVALAGPAHIQGRMVADTICGRTMHYRGSSNTAVCQVFDLTVGFAGLSVSALHHFGLKPLWVTAHPPDHATYYPNVHSITIKLAFEETTGRILGVQAVGRAGVDKRLDVLATAMQARMSVLDLEHLELGYAPPYSSAKDAVNIVGCVAANVLRADCRVVHAEDLNIENLAKWQVVDVRSPEEFASSHIFPAINLPVDTLRERISTLDKSKSVLTYCYVGYRGYLACKILSQNGFDTFNLNGGLKTVIESGLKNLVQHRDQ